MQCCPVPTVPSPHLALFQLEEVSSCSFSSWHSSEFCKGRIQSLALPGGVRTEHNCYLFPQALCKQSDAIIAIIVIAFVLGKIPFWFSVVNYPLFVFPPLQTTFQSLGCLFCQVMHHFSALGYWAMSGTVLHSFLTFSGSKNSQRSLTSINISSAHPMAGLT